MALVGLIAFRFLRPEEQTVNYETRPTVRVQTPETADIILYTDLTGTIEPQSTASVQPKISGEILEVYFQAGEQVTEGQVLCQIDSDSLTSLRLQMEAAQVALNDANNTLARTQGEFLSRLWNRPKTGRRMPESPMSPLRISMISRWNILR